MLKPRLLVAPLQPLISLNEAKAHLRVDHDDDDALIAGFVAAATDWMDGYSGVLGRALLTQTWSQEFDGFSCLRLALNPVQSVSIAYVDAAGAVTPLAGSAYVLREDALSPYLEPVFGGVWPSVWAQADAVRVTYVCGYTSPGLVPEAIRQAAKLLLAHWHENREAADAGGANSMGEVPLGVKALIAPFKRWDV
jgi:uncharacterized phiE125 gp8 family phage protein